MLLLTGSLILGGNIYDTVRINIEGNLNLRNTSLCGENTVQSELTKALVVSCKFSLTLYYIDINGSLIIRCGREDLRSSGRNSCISLNKRCCHTAKCLDRKGKRCNIKKKNITCSCFSAKLSTLYCSTERHALIRVQILGRLFSG